MEWTEVHRKLRPNNSNTEEEETTYFVTNVPKMASKREVWKTYASFGWLLDVYMANNRGMNGEYFVFICFLRVECIKELERRMDGQKLRGRTPTVNLSLHGRKEPTSGPYRNNGNDERKNQAPPAVPQPAWYTARTSLRDHHSYTDLMTSAPTTTLTTCPPRPPLPTPITLRHKPATHSWLRKTTLVGEAVSLNHLGHLPKLLLVKGETRIKIKYLGGLMVLILFDYSVEAKEFMANEFSWKNHLKWLNWGKKTETHFEQVEWIRIVGLPLHLWGEHNFNTTSRGLG